jgi:hypothetical protein
MMNTMNNMLPTQMKDSDSNAEKDRPKRARSAYNYFFRAERATLLGISEEELDAQQQQKRKHRKTPGMIGFANLASSVGDKWKLLNEEEKLPYKMKSQADKERYTRDLDSWRKKHGLLTSTDGISGKLSLSQEARKQQGSCPPSKRKRIEAQQKNLTPSTLAFDADCNIARVSSFDAHQTRKNLLAEMFEPSTIHEMVTRGKCSVEDDIELRELAALDEWKILLQKLGN